ncbi:conserved hypothetical protein [Talaromyces stipitatus ATCC 10500]|uniref:Vacuolar ATPase assembly protein VMA22 n=1 Tax=Talaromyces stipitatus (strain ATCC 10500 / CBS 375.48 / QM 6759 / NRRL 1006) TaxID=441959 RepID=B8MLW2_TALSN|nr:uncharacterized protein TSTA_101280 [Talaromyces stipitatus ATCC 10500]EED13888.1 conserved hypothetical protein [Talaromyces stipitatus ATCC 10500]
MSRISTPPLSPETSIEPKDEKCESTNNKIRQLDNLLERYLHLLDTHQKLQESVGKQLSSGFFQLAHANYVSSGRRFGEDFYDERMKATRRFWMSTRLEKVRFEVKYKSVLDQKNEDGEVNSKEEEEEEEAEQTAKEPVADETQHSNSDNEQQPDPASEIVTPPAQSEETTNSDKEEDTDSTTHYPEKVEESNKKKKKIFRSDDPISWYGILVPASLRSAQKSFIGAVDGGILELVSVISEMRCVEDMVYELRGEIEKKNRIDTRQEEVDPWLNRYVT